MLILKGEVLSDFFQFRSPPQPNPCSDLLRESTNSSHRSTQGIVEIGFPQKVNGWNFWISSEGRRMGLIDWFFFGKCVPEGAYYIKKSPPR